MKVLFLKRQREDYLGDMILHGLRCLPDVEVVDYPRQSHMYEDYSGPRLYGNGFGIFKTLPEIPVNRDVDNQSFDAIVLGEPFRECPYWDLALSGDLSPGKVAVLDGADETRLRAPEAVDRATYFKRELADGHYPAHPISFCFPEEKLIQSTKKDRVVAEHIPFTRLSNPTVPTEYKHEEEGDFYDEYLRSKYALTVKRAGWDAQRHYEIIFNDCVPIFLGLDQCPPRTLFRFPKDLLNQHYRGMIPYDHTRAELREHAAKFLTTRAMATYLLERLDV